MALTKITRGLLNTGVSDSSDATAITIDSSENVLVGATSYNNDNAGVGLGSSGFLYATRDGSLAASFKRLTSTGSIADFRKDSSTIASVTSDGICFGSDSAAANALNDYEEGDWQPTNADSGETANMAANSARYTKIGNFVSIRFDINNNSGNHAHLIGGLPFPVKSGAHGSIQISYNNLSSGTSGFTTGYCNAGTTYIRLTIDGGTDAWQLNNGYRIIGFGAYETDQ